MSVLPGFGAAFRAVAVALVLAGPAVAQQDDGLDLQPADFIPGEPIAIRVDALEPGTKGSVIAVTILNRTKASVEATAECTLYDAAREDLGVAMGRAVTIPAGERKTATVTGAEGAKFAECRVGNAG